MKKLTLIASLLALTILFGACSSSDDKVYDSNASAIDVLNRMVTSANEYEARDGVEYLENGLIYNGASTVEGEFLSEGQKSMIYGTIAGDPDFSGVADYALWTASDSVATEIGVFKAADKKAAETIAAFIDERINTLMTISKDYKPEEYTKAENALVVTKGLYVIYIVTNINEELEAIADAAIIEKAAE